jgi:hypothetical protein
MAEKRQIGAILLDSGRITDDDVQRVLEYQREHGGFFGQGLVALGIVSRQEIDWALASQFDLPFIFPSADTVDPAVARLVPADWALAHMAVPLVKAGNALTVVVADPLRREVVDELRARTGCQVDMALASAARIRELIHAVYDASESNRLDHSPAMSFAEFLGHAMEEGGQRFGVSVRGDSALAWWRGRGDTQRVPLQDGWEAELDNLIQPRTSDHIDGLTDGQVAWHATTRRGAADLPLDVRALVGTGGLELLFRPAEKGRRGGVAGGVILPPTLVTELRLLWRSGSARVGVGSASIEYARALLPLLPALALGDNVRSVHLDDGTGGATTYSLRAEQNDAFPDVIASFELDAVTLDLPARGYPVVALLRTAPLAFMILDEPEERAAPMEWGINWLLTITGQPGSHAWDLRALYR